MGLITMTRAAQLLDVANAAGVRKLIDAGLLPNPLRVGRQALLDEDAVAALAAWPPVASPPPALVVRMGPKAPAPADDTERRWIGYTAGSYEDGLTPDENERIRRDAVRGWWNPGPPARFLGLPLVATVVSYVATVYQIGEGFDRRPDGIVRFQIDDAPADVRKTFQRHRLRLPPGATAVPIGR